MLTLSPFLSTLPRFVSRYRVREELEELVVVSEECCEHLVMLSRLKESQLCTEALCRDFRDRWRSPPSELVSFLTKSIKVFLNIISGMYERVKEVYMTQFRVSNAHGLEMLGVRTLAGVTTATLAILAAQPTDVVKIRMQAGARTGQYR